MNEESVFIDLDKEVDEKTVKEAELSANAAVWKIIPLPFIMFLTRNSESMAFVRKTISCGASSASSISKRAIPVPAAGPIRLRHGGLIKVIRFSRYKGGSRIEFLCGKRAVEAIHERSRILEETSNLLSVKSEEVLPAVEKLHQEVLDLKASLRERTQDLFPG